MSKDVIHFTRKRDLTWVRALGAGACGQTVLLHDDTIDEYYVCKKYFPYEEQREILFERFVREIKLMYALHHPNVVRVFNHYLYPQEFTGYILMEYVEGMEIDEFVRVHPDHIDNLFRQAIEGFCHLEDREILHRDVRPANLLVSGDGELKIIDFGFGKRIDKSANADKSVTLNWWCVPPQEFDDATYDFGSDVYFVGQLFRQLLVDSKIEEFEFRSLLNEMCERDPACRIPRFSAIRQKVLASDYDALAFEKHEVDAYRWLASELSRALTKIKKGAKYLTDPEQVLRKLDQAYRDAILEEFLPSAAVLPRCFIAGEYYYKRDCQIKVEVLRNFRRVFGACPGDKRALILGNLHGRLDTVDRYGDTPPASEYNFDDIPF